jgi:hypothetical protein
MADRCAKNAQDEIPGDLLPEKRTIGSQIDKGLILNALGEKVS